MRQLRRRIVELEVWQQQARAQAAQQEQQQQHAALKRGGGGDGQQDKDQGACGAARAACSQLLGAVCVAAACVCVCSVPMFPYCTFLSW